MASKMEYVVEAIVGQRVRRGKVQYLIKWKDCDESENSWEPPINLNCKDLLEKFMREQAEKQPPRRQSKRSSGDANANPQPQDGSSEDAEKKAKRESLPRGSKVAGPTNGAAPAAPVAKPLQKRKTMGKNGFEKGHEVQHLMGVTEDGGELYFLVRWKGVNELEMVPSEIVRQQVPELVLDFYESRIIWNPVTKKTEE